MTKKKNQKLKTKIGIESITVGTKKTVQRPTVKKFPVNPQTPNIRKIKPAATIEIKRVTPMFHGISKKKK
jgi:hypothetical protein